MIDSLPGQIERELELQQTKEMLARLGKKVDNVDKMDKSGREVSGLCRIRIRTYAYVFSNRLDEPGQTCETLSTSRIESYHNLIYFYTVRTSALIELDIVSFINAAVAA